MKTKTETGWAVFNRGGQIFTSPVRRRKIMTELTEKQKEQMEAELKPAIKKQGFSESFYTEKMYFMRGFKAGYTAAVNRECVWNDASAGLSCFYETSCGVAIFQSNEIFCPNCGGKVVEGKDE